MQPNTAEFFARYDLTILDATNRCEAQAIRDRSIVNPEVAREWRDYNVTFTHLQRLVARLYRHQRAGGDDAVLGGKLDLYRVFAERMVRLLDLDGVIGMVVPSAFHANEGATGVRKLYLQETNVEHCLSFENRRSLFDIHARYKFALVVARRPGPTLDLRCGFYLTEFGDLDAQNRWRTYDQDFITASGGAYATLLELRDATDLALARRMYLCGQKFGPYLEETGITLSREII